jgi:Protein of unknown function (DUF3780)
VTKPRPKTLGFGFDPRLSPYHFVAVLPDDTTGSVVIEERFGYQDDERDDAGQTPRGRAVKVVIDAYRWSRIAGTVRAQFNRRLRLEGLPNARWLAGEVTLAPHFGKELTLLAWAVEDADPTLIPNMIANWLGLEPEERWWLYSTVNATSGHPEHGKDRGWRKAIKIAFAENPAGTAPSTFQAPPEEPVHLPVAREPETPLPAEGAGHESAPEIRVPHVPKQRPRGRKPGTRSRKPEKGTDGQLDLLAGGTP